MSIRIARVAFIVAAFVSAGRVTTIHAQNRGGGAPQTAKAAAPLDLTGYWVAVVSEEWRYRMMTPPKGDFRGVPLNPEGMRVANAWNPSGTDGAADACMAYGAPAIMRVPGRLHITWQDDNTLRLDTDAGTQTRLFQFAASNSAAGARTWQGQSSAQWDRTGGRGAAGAGALAVTTTNLRAGYLRRNGVPYSENARLTEYFDLAPLPGGSQLMVVTSIVDDPKYMQRPFALSSHFKKEANASKWDPSPCSASW